MGLTKYSKESHQEHLLSNMLTDKIDSLPISHKDMYELRQSIKKLNVTVARRATASIVEYIILYAIRELDHDGAIEYLNSKRKQPNK